MKNPLILLLLLTPTLSLADDRRPPCGHDESRTVLNLLMWRAFEGITELQVCEGKGVALLEAKTYLEGTNRNEKIKVIPLGEGTYKRVLALHKEALSLNLKEKEQLSLDGTSWCLETTQKYVYSKACFPSPLIDSSKRGLTGLSKLGQELWRLADFRGTNGKLHLQPAA